ncbi:MAG: hypothetical protein ACK559_21745, partial [bacterium]
MLAVAGRTRVRGDDAVVGELLAALTGEAQANHWKSISTGEKQPSLSRCGAGRQPRRTGSQRQLQAQAGAIGPQSGRDQRLGARRFPRGP